MEIYREPSCPHCGGTELNVYASHRRGAHTRVRYMKCACGHRFAALFTTLPVFHPLEHSPHDGNGRRGRLGVTMEQPG